MVRPRVVLGEVLRGGLTHVSALERRVIAGAEARLLDTNEDRSTSVRLQVDCFYLRFRSLALARLVRRGVLAPASSWKVFTAAALRPGDVVFDLGANLGRVTHHLSCLVGRGGHVHAFEPSPSVASCLRRRVDLLALGNVVVNEMAVADEVGTATLHEYREHHGGASALRPNPQIGYDLTGRCKVAVTTVDAYTESRGLASLRMIKMDVEGSEVEVLTGAVRTIDRFRPVILTEVSRQANVAFDREPDVLVRSLRELGYQTYSWRRGQFVPFSGSSDLPPGRRHDDVLCLDPDLHVEVVEAMQRFQRRSRRSSG